MASLMRERDTQHLLSCIFKQLKRGQEGSPPVSLLVMLFAFPISRYFVDETVLSRAITVHGEHADGGGEIQPYHSPCV